MTDPLLADYRQALSDYCAAFDDIPDSLANTWTPEAEKTPAENLAAMIGWTRRAADVLTCEQKTGAASTTPLPGFGWDEKEAVELAFEDEATGLGLAELQDRLRSEALRLEKVLRTSPAATTSPWFCAFARHGESPGLGRVCESDARRFFLLALPAQKKTALLTWKKAVQTADIKPPHALWWY